MSTHNITVLGTFAPAMFHPQWLSAHSLIRKSEADTASVKVISSDISFFSLEWLEIQILPERAIFVSAQEPYFEALRDLVVGVFEIITTAPIKQIGFNYQRHYTSSSEKLWSTLSGEFPSSSRIFASLPDPEIESIKLSCKRPYNSLPGAFNLILEPSKLFPNGLYINSNDHYEINGYSDDQGSGPAMDIITEQWGLSKDFLTSVVSSLVTQA
jgi:hypothetical protein